MKANKHFTKKKVLKTNHRDVLIAEQLESNSKEEIEAATAATAVVTEASAVAEIDGNLKGE